MLIQSLKVISGLKIRGVYEMIKLFKRLFCKHRYVACGCRLERNKDGSFTLKHIWKRGGSRTAEIKIVATSQ